ncbi:ImmA/IrrE family metallo-endopeptidase [Mycobacterium intracellulare]|uniref:ImmA/IrrE family metallo-endopeptidase n=1 Tax=Mycobacterium intracellulare TaxID=1767 RepID=UPI001EEEC53C|nr:ImmA/IrrE family metallo-endopeptidase [Mycobacterium intracellulare]MEE3750093.1 ImmA/IrrE family metallo-endopeptidase [Mycobacterium intracellulare]
MATYRVDVEPALLDWAIERSRIDRDELYSKRALRDLPLWQRREKKPTYNELQTFARATHTPFGMLFLSTPPVEKVPIPDFRTIADAEVTTPSPDLLETIYMCEQRQEWYRKYAARNDYDPLDFVGSATINDPIAVTADKIRRRLGFTSDDRARDRTWSEALRRLIDSAEDIGILVMISGIVGNNTRRVLDPNEFRGFALSDPLAPLIFINGADTKAAQIFTLIHEVAHIWLGQSALTDARLDTPTAGRAASNQVEQWCNRVAAEVLVPLASFRPVWPYDSDELDRLARIHKVSTLVVLRRIYDAGHLKWADFRQRYEAELGRVMGILAGRQAESGGGNYYYTQPLRISQRFAHAVISDAVAGNTLYNDAYRLIGTRKHQTFVQLGEQVGAI